MTTYTQQEIFDKVWEYAKTMERPSNIVVEGLCMYRGPGGNKCFVGILIPDEVYSPDMEGLPARDLIFAFREVMESIGLSNDHVLFLTDLQEVHDDASAMFPIGGDSFRKELLRGLKEVLVKYNLKRPE